MTKKQFEQESYIKEKIMHILLEQKQGTTITELTKLSKIPRSAVRIQLARLEGANKVNIRKIGMAKVYILNRDNLYMNEDITRTSYEEISGDSNR